MTKPIAVTCSDDIYVEQAKKLANEISLPFIQKADFSSDEFAAYIIMSEDGISLQESGKDAAGPIYVDFVSGAMGHRLKYGGGKGQMIAKACGLQKFKSPYILDATAGLGRDGFVLASLGANVQMIERVPVIAALLKDGLRRAAESEITKNIAGKISFHEGNAIEYINNLTLQPDIIYIDPMFPERTKTAAVKKEMRIFKKIIGADEDDGALLAAALNKAKHRVVAKRPRIAPHINDMKPSYILEGKSGRFDVYVR